MIQQYQGESAKEKKRGMWQERELENVGRPWNPRERIKMPCGFGKDAD